MKTVQWVVHCETLVNTDNEGEAREEVMTLFEEKVWGDTGKCLTTLESMEITGCR